MPKKKFRQPTVEVEKELSSQEIKHLDEEMSTYVVGLKDRVEEIKTQLSNILIDDSMKETLEAEQADLEEQINKIESFDSSLAAGDFDSVTTKPIN